MERRTWSPKGHEAHADRRWFIVDADGRTLGRLASVVAAVVRGKNKPTYTPHMDMGDYVVVVNADKVVVTGNKETQKFYYKYSGYPGGLKKRSIRQVRQSHPTRLIEAAVRGMLPKTVLGEKQLKKLKVYAGPSHPHASQQPTPIDLAPSGAERQLRDRA